MIRLSPRRPFALLFVVSTAFFASTAFGGEPETATDFVKKEHAGLLSTLRTPAGPGRETALNEKLEKFVDFDEIARRTFGQPCPLQVVTCTNYWTTFNDAQKKEVSGLLKKLIQKNYRKNFDKTVDYDVSFTAPKQVGEHLVRVRTEAKSKSNVREPATQIDYVVQISGDSLRVMDIVTEGSSLSKSYNRQFADILGNAAQGYGHLVKKLNEKIAAR